MTPHENSPHLGYRRAHPGDRDRATARVRRLTAATGVAALTGAGALTLALAATGGTSTATTATSASQQSAGTTSAPSSSAPSKSTSVVPAATVQQPVTHSGGS